MQPGQGYEFSKQSSTPGDESAKARWEQFAKVDKARQAYEKAVRRRLSAQNELAAAHSAVIGAAVDLELARAELESLTRADAADLPAPTQVTI